MVITCLDMEGVLVPEIWIAFAEATGIPELKRTTRDEPDYDKLMNYRLEILKDSNSGAFAVITCAVYFMFYYGVYSQISARALAMIPFTFCLSRTLSGLAIVTFPKAKKTGSVSAMARWANDRQFKATMCVYLLILLVGMLLVEWKLGLLVYGIAILVYALYYRNAMKYFGGTTGDLAGCFLSLCEVFMACGAVLGALWL